MLQKDVKSVDPDETASQEESDVGHHCLVTALSKHLEAVS